MTLENKSEVLDRKTSNKNQYLAAGVCALSCVCCGFYSGWPSYAVPLLLSKDNKVFSEPISKRQADLLGGLPNVGAVLGTVLFGWFYDKYGRKRGGLLLAVPLMLSWTMILLAPSPGYILVARFLAGLSGGGASNLPPLYIGETADVSIKGALGSFLALGFGLGILLSFIIGSLVGYFTTSMIFLGIVLVYSLLMSFMPETPEFLMKNGMEEEAAKSLAWLRSTSVHSPVVLEELSYLRLHLKSLTAVNDSKLGTNKLDEIKHNKEEFKSLGDMKTYTSDENSNSRSKQPAWKYLIFDRPSRNAFTVTILLFTFQVCVGSYAMQTYAADIFMAANVRISPHICSIVYATSMVFGSLVSSSLADKAGRKILMIVSCSGMAVVLILTGYSLQTGFGPTILPVICICSCVFLFNLGAGSIPFVVMGEYFCNEVKDLCACLLVQYSCFLSFLVTFFLKTGIEELGIHGMFYVFGSVSVTATIYSIIFLPETKGLHRDEILKIFGGSKITPHINEYNKVPTSDV